MGLKTGLLKQLRIHNILMLLLICCLAVLLAWLSVRYQIQIDLTASGRHTLSTASQDILKQIAYPIKITAYAKKNTILRREIKKFISRYQQFQPDIELHFVDPDLVPEEVRQQGITVNGEMILLYQERTEHVKSTSEKELTNALNRLVRGTDQWLTFVTGHGERDPLGKANHDLGMWSKQITARGIKVQPLDLASIQDIPANTKVLVITSPTINFLPGEIALISSYLSNGGNLLWLVDPDEDGLHGLEIIAAQLSIEIGSDVVIDTAGNLIGIDDPTIVLNTPSLYPEHIITENFDYTTLFPKATHIEISHQAQWQKTDLLMTATHTWLERSEPKGKISYDQESDKIGPLRIGLTLEKLIENEDQDQVDKLPAKSQRIVVIGDGDFLSNTYVGNSGNLELGMRLINWLASEDNLIDIPVSVVSDANIELSPFAAAVIGLGFIFVLPVTLLMTGFIIWWRRNKKSS